MGSSVMMYVLPMILGQTYHLGKDQTGIPIFLGSDTSKAKEISQYFTDSQYSMVQSASEVRDFLDISGKLSLKIKAGKIKASGEGQYVKDSSSKRNALEILIKLHFETVTKTIPTSVKPGVDWKNFDKDLLGTHYCRSITYGGDLIASIRISASSVYDMERIKGAFSLDLKMSTVSMDIKARLDKLKSDAQDSSSMEIDYYATVPLKGVSYTIDGLMKLVDDFPNHVKSVNNGLGNPLRMELYPLASLSGDFTAFIENRTMTELLSDFEDQFDDLRKTRKALESWISDLPPDLPTDAENSIQEFSDKVNSVYELYMVTIADLDVSITASTDAIYKAIDSYRHGEYIIPDKYIRQFDELQRDLYEKYPELKPKIGGASYTRWGRSDCGTQDAEVVEEGVAAASESYQNGGSTDYFCSSLYPDLQNATTYFPHYNPDETEDEGKVIMISPLRYNGKLDKFKDMASKHLACARCRVSHRAAVMVKPGDKNCPDGYTLEYQGILMAPGINAVPKGSHICVDVQMQEAGSADFGSESPNRLASVQEVFVECGSLPCPSYATKKPIPCVVCTV